MIQLNPGASVEEFLGAFEPGAPPGQGRRGFQAIKSGGGGVFTTDFAPGNYALVCFVEDPTPARLILPWE